MQIRIKDILVKLTVREDLSDGEIVRLIAAIKEDELNDVQIAGFLVALLMKGVSVPEITSIAKAMRANCVPLKPRVQEDLLDTCGTGGGLSTFNISTATAIVAAAAGIPVAKHGSRSLSSLSGSADVLEALGVEINLSAQAAERLIEEIGIAFLYAPLFHPVMCRVLPVEAALGIKTIFYTLIGPLINPAFAPRHLLGVYKLDLLETVAEAAKAIGFKQAMFVHGLDGLDEISLLGKTRVIELKDGVLTRYDIVPEDFGLARCRLEDIKTQVPERNAKIIEGVFAGTISGAQRDAIILNAAGALKVAGKVNSFAEGIALANELIDSRRAEHKLQQLREMSRSFSVCSEQESNYFEARR